MKTNFILIILFASLGYITLSSRSGGAGTVANEEVAGTPGTTRTCMSCHLGGTFNATTTIDIKNSSGTSVTTVQSDSVYDVSVTIVAASGTPAAYGFQAIFLENQNNTNTGTFQNLGTGQTTKTFTNGRVAVEHNTPSTSNTFSFKWKAPAVSVAQTATLYTYAMCVNLNFNGTGDSGDAHTYQVTIQPSTPSSVSMNQSSAEMTLFPNPVVNDVNVNITLQKETQLQLSVFSADGKIIRNQTVNAMEGLNNFSMNLSDLSAGAYLLVLSDDTKKLRSKSFVKF
jgi:hypothetical protein